jgi:hypothetical protein
MPQEFLSPLTYFQGTKMNGTNKIYVCFMVSEYPSEIALTLPQS